jgi:hypothetical protein
MELLSKAFVFVVCGAEEHINTLNFSLKALKMRTVLPILVVTDLNRNEVDIDHHADGIIDVRTPDALNHHQASIWLKTSLHRYMPFETWLYCYLDTDVVAVRDNVDEVFEDYVPPILFAPDHCRLPSFSAHAVHCRCLEKWEDWSRVLTNAINRHDRNLKLTNPETLALAAELRAELAKIVRSVPLKLSSALRYVISPRTFRLNDRFWFDKRSRTWKSHTGEVVLYELNVRQIERETGFRYKRWSQRWLTGKGERIWPKECDHLRTAIRKKFGTDVKVRNWQHWNGGLFLFNHQSHAFLESWHSKTLEAFNDPYWRTRDQGTLIATAWEFGLDRHPSLPRHFNFIADYHHPTMTYLGGLRFRLSAEPEVITPVLMHIYHHWGDLEWDVWRDVENLIKEE